MLETSQMYISKTNMMLGMRCPKALHLALHRKDLKAKIDPATQARFDQGNEVGARAREYFDSQGALIHAKPWEYGPSIKATQQAIQSQETQTIFEAAFSDGTLYSRADILHKKNQEWHLIEVKDGTKVKDEHVVDVAIQVATMRRSGFEPKSYSVMRLNREAIFPDLEELFVIEDVTERVEAALPDIEKKIDELVALSKHAQEPQMKIGEHCKEPYDCSFKEHCWAKIPPNSVFDLPRISVDVAVSLMDKGLLEIKQLKPDTFPENKLYQRIIQATKSGERFIDPPGLKERIKDWQYPLYFLDFETVMPAIPRYEGTCAYTMICYQFSCHILRAAGAELEHREYLHTATGDPREKLVSELCAAIGDTGSVVAYYATFEKQRMQELAAVFPQHAEKLESICSRLVDPLPMMREFVYDAGFAGSFSIKDVAPVLLGAEFRYDNKEVSDGLLAGVWADRILRGFMTNPAEIASVREKLLAYCRQDTMAMVRLWEWMSKPH